MEQQQIYPSLSNMVLKTDSKEPNQVYRFSELKRIRNLLIEDIKKYTRLLKRNKSICRKLNISENALTTVSVFLGVGGISSVLVFMDSIPFLLPITLSIEGVAVLSTASTGLLKHIHKKFLSKMMKYQILLTLSQTKYNLISNTISSCLEDNVISEDEYNIIITEFDKYTLEKGDIQRGTQLQINVDELEDEIAKNLSKTDVTRLKKLLEGYSSKKEEK